LADTVYSASIFAVATTDSITEINTTLLAVEPLAVGTVGITNRLNPLTN
jgi:hypothetical protein